MQRPWGREAPGSGGGARVQGGWDGGNEGAGVGEDWGNLQEWGWALQMLGGVGSTSSPGQGRSLQRLLGGDKVSFVLLELTLPVHGNTGQISGWGEERQQEDLGGLDRHPPPRRELLTGVRAGRGEGRAGRRV